VFDNRVRRRIFGSKREEKPGEWRRFYDLYSSPNMNHLMLYRNISCDILFRLLINLISCSVWLISEEWRDGRSVLRVEGKDRFVKGFCGA
jgi:hypothetical protein